MFNPNRIVLIVILILTEFMSFGQKDSLELELKKADSDTSKIKLLTQIGWEILGDSPEEALTYANSAEQYLKVAKDPYLANNVYRLKAFCYGDMNNRPSCLKNHLIRVQVLQTIEEPTVELAAAYYETAAVFQAQSQDEAAKDYYQKCGEVAKKIGNKAIYGQSLMPLANIKRDKGDLEGAKANLRLGAKLTKETNPLVAAIMLSDLSEILVEQDSIQVATPVIDTALRMIDSFNSPEHEGFVYQGAGVIESYKGNNQKAIDYFKQALQMWQPMNKYFYLQDLYLQLGDAYQGIQSDSSTKYYQKHIELSQQVNNENNNKQIAEMEAKYKNAEKEKEIALLSKENEIAELEKSRQTQISTIALIGLGVAFLLILIVISRMRIIRKQKNLIEEKSNEVSRQKDIIEEKSKELMDSIIYAKRIQSAALPANDELNKVFGNANIVYLPKDELSGDFYWLGKIKDKKGNNLNVIALGDCTGHGVPGALLSILGINYLNISRSNKENDSPAAILNFLNEGLHSTFSSSSSQGEIRDGMDIVVAAFDEESEKLYYSAAKNPIYIIRNGELITLKGNRHAVGKGNRTDEPIPFENFEFKLHKDDLIYMFSDGYADQFGGEKGKKMGYKNFKKLLLENADKSLKEQNEILLKHFQSWKKDLEQLDDVCVIGVKV